MSYCHKFSLTQNHFNIFSTSWLSLNGREMAKSLQPQALKILSFPKLDSQKTAADRRFLVFHYFSQKSQWQDGGYQVRQAVV